MNYDLNPTFFSDLKSGLSAPIVFAFGIIEADASST